MEKLTIFFLQLDIILIISFFLLKDFFSYDLIFLSKNEEYEKKYYCVKIFNSIRISINKNIKKNYKFCV